MQDKLCKLSRMAAVVVMFMAAWAGSAWASGVPWQVGDIVVCYGGGNCNVIRLHGSAVQVLDTISSGLLGSNSGVGLNNTLHVLATDDVGASASKVVVYSIASINPFNPSVNPLTHTPISTFDGSGGGNGKAAAIAVNSAGHIFVGNSNPASIVELNADGSSTGNVFSFPTSGTCATTTLNSLDLSAAGNALYVTAGDGVIRNVPTPFSPNSCTEFANFGPQVNLYGIKDIPAGALAGNCPSGTCSSETILVVAKGFVDLDTGETGEGTETNNPPDAVNVCTNSLGGSSESCALLLSTATQTTPLSGAVWHAGHLYDTNTVNNTTILDAYLRVQTVSTPGTAGSEEPVWTHDSGAIVRDNAVVWTNQDGWKAGTPYTQNTSTVGDTNSHLWLATTTGTSGSTPPDFVNHENGTVIDGLQWKDRQTTCSDSCPDPWSAGQFYGSGSIQDDNHEVWDVVTPGTSGALGNRPPFEANDNSGVTLPDNDVVWSDQGSFAWQPIHTYTVTPGVTDHAGIVVDPSGNVEKVTTAGTSGPANPNNSTIPYSGWNSNSIPPNNTTTDGLQWQDQGLSPAIIYRYQVQAGDTLRALALDPLVSDCTGGSPAGTACSTSPPPARKVTNSGQLVAVSPSFWMGDTNGTGTIYRQPFAGGSPIPIPGACPSGCVIQGIVVYGGESANQPGLASLVSNDGLTSNNTTATASFFQNNIISTLSNNNGSALSGPATPISLYASRVDKTSCFTDPGALNLPCRATDPNDSTKAFVWKLDIPLNGNAALPTAQTLNTAITPPSGTFDNSTDVFVDEQFDDTTFVGGDPGTRTISVHSLHEVAFQFDQGASQCTYSSPLANGCYKTNRGTLNFIFTCPGLSQTKFQSLQPVLSLVIKPQNQAPQFIPLAGTNGKAPYRFDPKTNTWTFQWNLKGAAVGTYLGTTFDNAGVVQSFPVKFFLKNSCP